MPRLRWLSVMSAIGPNGTKRRRRREAKAKRRTLSGGNFVLREELARSAKGKIVDATGFDWGRRS